MQIMVPGLAAADGEERLRLLIEAFPSGLILVGSDGRLRLVNQRALRMFGYGAEALLGQPLEMLLPARFRPQHPGLRAQFMGETGSRAMGQGRDLYALRRDGSEFPIEIGLNPILWDGQMTVLAAIVDITERKAAEAEQARQRQELERSNADLQEFAYVASHDLKAPLRAVAHLAEWIAEDIGGVADAQTQENLALLRQRVTRLQALMDGLLTYSRVGRSLGVIEPVDIGDMLADIVAGLGPPPGFTVTWPDDLPMIRTIRSPLEHVLQNLIANAIAHHDRPEGQVSIAVARGEGRLVEFRVADDGPGIPPRFHERIFVIFQTLASRDDKEASGIGLAIVKKTVERHGGRITVLSNPPERGTSFVFTWLENPA